MCPVCLNFLYFNPNCFAQGRRTMGKKHLFLAMLVIVAMLVSSCATNPAPAAGGGGAAAPAAGGTTFVGTPRNETLILDNLGGVVSRPDFFNPYAPGVDMGR